MSDLDKIISFFNRIGIETVEAEPNDPFFSGVSIAGGKITYRRDDLQTPGILLHEAGHLAVVPEQFRPLLTSDISSLRPHFDAWFEAHPDCMNHPEHPLARYIIQAGETEAVAWSYAAALAAGVDTMLPFRDLVEDAQTEHDIISWGQYLGVNGLHHAKMTRKPHPQVDPKDTFPNMIRWLQA